jgi:iron complex transport system substrate-binding protein
VVSLVPAATEIAVALGVADLLVAVTHDDDHPAVAALPRVTRTTIPPNATAREIDTLVRDAGTRGESTFHLDADMLRDAAPDLILGQTLCAVCAVTLDALPAAVRERRVVPLDATSLAGVFEDIRRVGRALDRGAAAEHLVARLESRIARVASAVASVARPRVACLEWLDPPFNGGHWVPEQVAIAGGTDVLGIAGERSRVISWEDVRAAHPDVVAVMPCGWDAERAAVEAEGVPRVGARIVAVDGAAYFSRPGPRLIDGIELLASILHPGRVAAPFGARAIQLAEPVTSPGTR